MFSSSSTSFDPFHHSTISPSFSDSFNPNPSPFLQFSAPFLDHNGDLVLSDHLIPNLDHNHQNLGLEAQPNPATSIKRMRMSSNKRKTKTTNDSKQATPPKRSGKKDRHSKIYTAHGPRDRRMRLSLQIARKFFDLQDMLGFDKASKTIDWLFSKSKSAIKEVTDNFPNLKTSTDNSCGGKCVYSSSGSSEVMSGSIKLVTTDSDSFPGQKKSNNLSDDKQVFSPWGKESRNMARARARERTKAKLKIKGIDKSKPSNPSPSNLEQSDGKSLDLEKQEMKMAIQEDQEKQEEEEEEEEEKTACVGMGSSVSIIDRYLGVREETKSTSIFDLSDENIAVSSGADFEDKFSGSIGRVLHHSNRSYISDTKLSTTTATITTGDVHLENPNFIFMNNLEPNKASINPNFIYQDQNLTSLLMATPDPHQHPNSSLFFMNLFSNSNQQNPIPLFPMSIPNLNSHFPENHFSCNPSLPNKYDDTFF